jgi:hypothetical protein
MGLHTTTRGYRSLSGGACNTRTWLLRLEWSRAIAAAYQKGGKYSAAIDQLLAAHRRRLPSSLEAGREIVTALEDEYLFPDTLYLMTACGSHPSWERARGGKTRLFSLIAYPSSF